MNNYEALFNKIIDKTGMTEAQLKEKIRLAQMWHNPLNYDKGETLKEQYGWDNLFTEALKKEGAGRRFYFSFHDIDTTNTNAVFNAFMNCSNWSRYSSIWRKHAPKGIKSPGIYLLAITEMSVRGFKHEEKIAQGYIDAGCEVRKSTGKEDLAGIDLWVDGKAVQVKSPATARRMKNVES